MRVDAFAVRLRPREPFEAADLGTRLCQSAARDVYSCLLVAAIPIAMLVAAARLESPWLALLVVSCAKPWLDRTILFVLSRAAFGQFCVFRRGRLQFVTVAVDFCQREVFREQRLHFVHGRRTQHCLTDSRAVGNAA